MGAQYRAYIDVRLVIDYESPEGWEAQLRAADIAEVILGKLPISKLYRSTRGGGKDPKVAGSPVVVSKTCKLDRCELRAVTGPGTGSKPTKGNKEASRGRRGAYRR